MSRARALCLALVAFLLAGCQLGGRGSAPPPPERPGADGGRDRLVWEWTAPTSASIGMPAADDREVAFTYGHRYLVVLDAEGRQRWQADRLGLRDVAPRLTPELVVAATDDGLAAFRRADGTTSWDTTVAARANTPVVVGRLAVASTWQGQLVAVDLADGRVAWTAALPGGSVGAPATDGAAVVVTWQREDRRRAGAVAVEGATGRRRWAVDLEPGGVSGPAVLPDATVVVVAGDLAAHSLSLGDGSERWRAPLEGAGSPEVPPVAVEPRSVLVAHRLGGLALLDSATGRREWHVGTDGAAVRGGPVIGPHRTFALPLDDGRLLLAGPERETEIRQAPGRISGVAIGPGGVLVAATRGAAVNAVAATTNW